ncbi:hypothetical protein BC826DRAFT_1013196, partial [Russula brevipes]
MNRGELQKNHTNATHEKPVTGKTPDRADRVTLRGIDTREIFAHHRHSCLNFATAQRRNAQTRH